MAAELLKADGQDVFLPLIREHRQVKERGHVWVNSVERPLFGPYLFVDGEVDTRARYVISVLKGAGSIGVVPPKVMNALIESADDQGVVVGRELPRLVRSRCIDFVASPGDLCNVTISLQKLIGVIQDVSRVERTGFVDVLVEMLGMQCKVNLHYTDVQLVSRLPPSGQNRRERRAGIVAGSPA
jgi:transcription antitermination factor NusG